MSCFVLATRCHVEEAKVPLFASSKNALQLTLAAFRSLDEVHVQVSLLVYVQGTADGPLLDIRLSSPKPCSSRRLCA